MHSILKLSTGVMSMDDADLITSSIEMFSWNVSAGRCEG
jgi:hypothetical protein